MDLHSASIPSPGNDKNRTRLHGHNLVIARVIWFTILVLALSFFFVGIPFRLQQLFTLSLEAEQALKHLSPGIGRSFLYVILSAHFYPLYVIVIEIVLVLGMAFSGLLIVRLKSDDWMTMFFSVAATTYATYITRQLDALMTAYPLLHTPISLLQAIGLGCALLFFYIFPNGQFVPSWTRPLTVIWIGWTIAWFLFPAVPFNLSNPYTLPFIWFLALMVWWFTGVLAQLHRYRHVSSPSLRQQTRWIVFSVTIAVLSYGAYFLPRLLIPFFSARTVLNVLYNVIGIPLFLSSLLIIPLFITFSVLRHHLFDVDVIINRSLVYGSLTACIVGIYALIVSALSSLLQVQGNFIVSLLSAGIVAVLFHPLRERLQQIVNRLFYGQRDEPYMVISQLGSQLEATLAPEHMLTVIVETIIRALKLPYAEIILPSQEDQTVQASVGTPREDVLRLPLRYQSELVGELLLAPRAPGENFNSRDQRLLEDLASQIGIAVYSARLTIDQQRLTADLQRSRTQLITVREEERRRLRRDLHDGLGSVLASLNLRTGAIRAQLVRDPDIAEGLLEEQQSTIRSAIADIRRLVYELRPPALDELGLVGALREQAAHYTTSTNAELQVTVDAPKELPVLPAAVEVATYRIVQEALANVIRHAHASSCWLQLSVVNGTLQVEVTDNGVGMSSDIHMGVGLLSMRERATEVGGSCRIQPGPKGGTQIRASLPFLID